MTAVMGFRKKKMEIRLFYFQNDRSGRPVLTPGKRPYVMPVSFFKAYKYHQSIAQLIVLMWKIKKNREIAFGIKINSC